MCGDGCASPTRLLPTSSRLRLKRRRSRKVFKEAARKGKAFPHIGRRSRRKIIIGLTCQMPLASGTIITQITGLSQIYGKDFFRLALAKAKRMINIIFQKFGSSRIFLVLC